MPLRPAHTRSGRGSCLHRGGILSVMGPAVTARIQGFLDLLRQGSVASAIVCCIGDARAVVKSSIGDRRVEGALEDFLRRREPYLSGEPAPSTPLLRDSLPDGYHVQVTLDREVCLLGVFPVEVDAWFASSRMRLTGRRLNEVLERDAAAQPPPGSAPPIPGEALAFEPPAPVRALRVPPSDWAPVGGVPKWQA